MLARIVDNHWIYLEQLTVPEEDIINEYFSVEHPNAQYIDTSLGFFDGKIRKYNRRHQRLSRAFLKDLTDLCDDKGLPIIVKDERDKPKYKIPEKSAVVPDLLPGITLEDYQIQSISAAIDHEVGLIQATTGAGKTEIMAGITKIMNRPTAILCDMKTVVDQIRERLELRQLGKVGVFYAGERPNGQKIIVGSFQSLVVPSQPRKKEKDTAESWQRKCKAFRTRRSNARKLQKMVKACDLLLVDECDTATSKQWRKLFTYWFNGRRKYGFSGTCFDPDKPIANLCLKENLGSIIADIGRKKVESTNRIIPIKYTALGFGDPKDIKSKAAFDIATKELMIENKQFHKAVKLLADRAIKDDPEHGVLVMVDSKPLGYALEELIPNSRFICGDHNMTYRKQAASDYEERKINVLIGGKIVKRGLDLKGGCGTLILATGGKLGADFKQRIGRAVRKNRHGFAQVYDFFFLNNHYLYAHSRKRLKAIVEIGYPSRVVFKEGVVDGAKFVRSRFRRPKAKR